MAPPLLSEHVDELRASALSDSTVATSQIWSITDHVRAEAILNSWVSLEDHVPALAIPYFSLSGARDDSYTRLKLSTPRSPGRKYESPRGSTSKAYIPPFGDLQAAIRHRGPLVIAEGEKKTLAANQAGVACIGITGNWSWCRRQTAEEKEERKKTGRCRELIDDLRGVDWRRIVLVCPDLDPTANSGVLLGFSELGRTLSHQGADVRWLAIPPIDYDHSGMPRKMGIDDYVLATSEDRFRDLAEKTCTPKTVVPINKWREQMRDARSDLKKGSIYIDRSGTGSGKTTADIEFASKQPSALVLADSHLQAKEIVKAFRSSGVQAKKYPKLGMEDNLVNCLNLDVAEKALYYGLSPSRSVCPHCKWLENCLYRRLVQETDEATHAVATKARAQNMLQHLTTGREFLMIQEDCMNLVAPILSCQSLDAFNDVAEFAHDGVLYHGYASPDIAGYFFALRSNAEQFRESLFRQVAGTQKLLPASTSYRVHPALFIAAEKKRKTQSSHANFVKALRICMAATEQQTESVVVVPAANGSRNGVFTRLRTEFDAKLTIVIGDSTAPATALKRILRRPVVDITPQGQIVQQKDIIQYPVDVTRSTGPTRFLGLVRAAMESRPHCSRIGVITFRDADDKSTMHHGFVSGKKHQHENQEYSLESRFLRRIKKTEYFGGGISRGSNKFIEEKCDLLIVVGTPRPGETAVVERLLQMRFDKAVLRDGCWMNRDAESAKHQGGFYWLAKTISGKCRTVRTKNYADHDWREANDSICTAELTQAVGRARANLASGMDVIVISAEPLGVPVADEADDLVPMSAAEVKVLEAIDSGCQSTKELARETALSVAHVEKARARLAARGSIRNAGSRHRPS